MEYHARDTRCDPCWGGFGSGTETTCEDEGWNTLQYSFLVSNLWMRAGVEYSSSAACADEDGTQYNSKINLQLGRCNKLYTYTII